jgi:hypothetical protein
LPRPSSTIAFHFSISSCFLFKEVLIYLLSYQKAAGITSKFSMGLPIRQKPAPLPCGKKFKIRAARMNPSEF